MRELVRAVVSDPSFAAEDEARTEEIVEPLREHLPGLGERGERVNWIQLSDHFACRRAHGTRFLSYDPASSPSPPPSEALAAKLAPRAHEHLCWRFSRWFGSPPLLSSVAGPMLSEVSSGMRRAADSPPPARVPFTQFSCHDVSLLGLLRGIGAPLASEPGFWPEYSAHLAFELHEGGGGSGG
jgi:hypothetical protein